ncbi:MAG: HAD family hydrolase [Clostridia bacterium]
MDALSHYQPQKEFLVCIDSDGCAFDTMEIKHKECFCPAAIDHFHLQPVSRYARDAWDFVNLYSDTRGIHRLLALIRVLDLLTNRYEVVQRGFQVPRLEGLRTWLKTTDTMSNDLMSAYCEQHSDAEDVKQTLAWSIDVNKRIAQMVHGVPPFPYVREGLEMLSDKADIVVVSATQQSALEREWREHALDGYAHLICGQEIATKKACICALKGHYAQDQVVMIGDAPGDHSAAKDNGALFYPICPDEEAASWKAFPQNMAHVFAHTYRGELENEKIAHFQSLLPSTPPWKKILP